MLMRKRDWMRRAKLQGVVTVPAAHRSKPCFPYHVWRVWLPTVGIKQLLIFWILCTSRLSLDCADDLSSDRLVLPAWVRNIVLIVDNLHEVVFYQTQNFRSCLSFPTFGIRSLQCLYIPFRNIIHRWLVRYCFEHQLVRYLDTLPKSQYDRDVDEMQYDSSSRLHYYYYRLLSISIIIISRYIVLL